MENKYVDNKKNQIFIINKTLNMHKNIKIKNQELFSKIDEICIFNFSF